MLVPIELMTALQNGSAPRPWRIDSCNDEGIAITADNGALVYSIGFKNMRELNVSERVQSEVKADAKANAILIINAVNFVSGKDYFL